MNPLVSVIALFAALREDLAARFNAALLNRPPLEAHEGANAAMGVLRELEWGQQRLERIGSEIGTTLQAAAAIVPDFEFRPGEKVEVAASRLAEKIEAATGNKAISTAIAAKTILPFEDHKTALDNAVSTAKEDTKKQLETDFNAKLNDVQTLSGRRTAAITKIGAIAAAALTDEDLLAEDHEARIKEKEDRITELTASGITEATRPKSFASLVACAKEEYDSRMEMIKEAGPAAPIAAAAPVTPTPGTPAPVLASGQSERTKAII